LIGNKFIGVNQMKRWFSFRKLVAASVAAVFVVVVGCTPASNEAGKVASSGSSSSGAGGGPLAEGRRPRRSVYRKLANVRTRRSGKDALIICFWHNPLVGDP
jgi:hypothetical protein